MCILDLIVSAGAASKCACPGHACILSQEDTRRSSLEPEPAISAIHHQAPSGTSSASTGRWVL